MQHAAAAVVRIALPEMLLLLLLLWQHTCCCCLLLLLLQSAQCHICCGPAVAAAAVGAAFFGFATLHICVTMPLALVHCSMPSIFAPSIAGSADYWQSCSQDGEQCVRSWLAAASTDLDWRWRQAWQIGLGWQALQLSWCSNWLVLLLLLL